MPFLSRRAAPILVSAALALITFLAITLFSFAQVVPKDDEQRTDSNQSLDRGVDPRVKVDDGQRKSIDDGRQVERNDRVRDADMQRGETGLRTSEERRDYGEGK